MILAPQATRYLFDQFKATALSLMTEEENPELTPHRKEMIKVMKEEMPGEYKDATIAFASALMDFDFAPYMKVASEYPVGIVIVPTGAAGTHSYKLGEPVLVWRGSVALQMDGTAGNNLPGIRSGTVRRATKEEIDLFFRKIMEPKSLEETGTIAFVQRMISTSEFEIAE